MSRREFPLIDAPRDREVILSSIEGGHGLRRRLADMGLREGMKIKVLQSNRPGPCIILAGQTRLIIGRGMAHKLLVREL